jgi:integrase
MASKWITAAPGIRYRQHPHRKHGARLDRYFTLRFSVEGRQIEEALGWASEGWTVALAQETLSRLRKAKRTGDGALTLREEAAAKRRAEQQLAEAEADRARREKTVQDLWDRYSKEVVATDNKPRTSRDKHRMWERRIGPAIGHLKINNVGAEDAGAVVRAPLRLSEGGQVVEGRAEAGNIYRLLHHLFSRAEVWGLRDRAAGNPLDPVAEPKVPRRERLLTGGEIGALLKELNDAEAANTERPQIIGAIRFALLSGARVGEVLSLQWEFVRREESELHLPDTKTGFSRRPISAAALAVLDGMERMPGVDFVFRSIHRPTRPLIYATIEAAFRRIAQKAGVPNCTLHSLRHWFATMAANSIANPRIGMALTGHKSHAAYLGYVHGDREQAHALANGLAALANGLAKADSNVTPMRKSKNA